MEPILLSWINQILLLNTAIEQIRIQVYSTGDGLEHRVVGLETVQAGIISALITVICLGCSGLPDEEGAEQ